MLLQKFLTPLIGPYNTYSKNVCKTYFSLKSVWRYSCITKHTNTYHVSTFNSYGQSKLSHTKFSQPNYCYSKGLLDDVITEEQSKVREIEFNTIAQLFPNPRVTLNELATKVPEKVFSLQYKQNVSPKGGRKKKIVQEKDWLCTYSFVWPEKMKFECTALSKKQAADKAANQALHWLYFNQRIDKRGLPIYDRNKIQEISSTLNEPLTASLTANSVERITRIWNDYEAEIKDIYAEAHERAMKTMMSPPAVITKDSTIDHDEEHPEPDAEFENETVNSEHMKVHPVYGKSIARPTKQDMDKRQRSLDRIFQRYNEELTPLPIDDYAKKIISILEQNRVAVIIGAAGCGKSTRAPAAILQHGGADVRAIVSEPRRVAAIGLAERVASELFEQVGDSVGYQVRLRSKPPRPPCGSLLYCTSGVLLKRLQNNPGLEGCTHVFIDEAHERDVNTDITLLLLKRALKLNKDLKVIIMSATLDADVFTKYFDNCATIEVPGRTYPVEVTYLEDFVKKLGPVSVTNTLESCKKEDGKPYIHINEVVNVIKAIDKKESDGAILVFLPGWAEIKAVSQRLNDFYGQSGTHLIIPVHSRLTPEQQSKMFSKPMAGVRKIVVATNIAETSITIPDVVYVLDCGSHKENRIREGTGVATLETVWVSRASAVQRTGRAGRVQPGNCYRMYTADKEHYFELHTTPEILRVPLDQTVLDCKTYAPDVRVADFLSELPEPPAQATIDFAIKDLIDLGAITSNEAVTSLGRVVSSLSLPARLAVSLTHSLLTATALSVSDVITHASLNSHIHNDLDRHEIREFKSRFSPTSDHMALHRIQADFEEELDKKGWHGVTQWCELNKLSKERLNYARVLSSIYLSHLVRIGIIQQNSDLKELNRFSNNEAMCVATILSGCNSLIVTRRQIKTKGKMATVKNAYTSFGDRAHIGSESVNHTLCKLPASQPDLLLHTGGRHSTERRALLVTLTSKIPPLTALLFSRGPLIKQTMRDNGETSILYLPRHNLRVQVPNSQADLLIKAKDMIWNTFQYHYERFTNSAGDEFDVTVCRFRIRLFKAIAKVLAEAERGVFVDEISENEENEDSG